MSSGNNLLLDLPSELYKRIWDLLKEHPLAILNLEMTSRVLRKRLAFQAWTCRDDMVEGQLEPLEDAADAALNRFSLQESIPLNRAEYLAACRAVGAYIVAAKQQLLRRCRMFKRMAQFLQLPPHVQLRMHGRFAGLEQATLHCCKAHQRLLQCYRR